MSIRYTAQHQVPGLEQAGAGALAEDVKEGEPEVGEISSWVLE